MRPSGTGRIAVRRISRSMSPSYTQLNAPADAAARPPPRTVQNNRGSGGMPREAMIIAATVVISSRYTMRGLESS
jgi:hypothetical protein